MSYFDFSHTPDKTSYKILNGQDVEIWLSLKELYRTRLTSSFIGNETSPERRQKLLEVTMCTKRDLGIRFRYCNSQSISPLPHPHFNSFLYLEMSSFKSFVYFSRAFYVCIDIQYLHQTGSTIRVVFYVLFCDMTC